MLISVVVRSKDEADRLRLVLASFTRQTVPFVTPGSPVPASGLAAELIVVDDGSRDHTRAILEEAADWLPFRVVRHDESRGLSAASNAGARVASGDVLLFFDGDTLASPGTVAAHAPTPGRPRAMARGETFHLRSTRFLLDPETGRPRPGEEGRVERLGPDLARHLVTRRQVIEDFPAIERRATPGIYPGAGPRLLAELERDALVNHPGLSVLWMAASGHNQSYPRADFEALGGYDERFTLNEHRELAFRMAARGLRLVPADGARSYHLTHRVGWRDPLADGDWERIFHAKHPCLAVKLMAVFWASLTDVRSIPEGAKILSLPQLDAIVLGGSAVDYDEVRLHIPGLARLSP